MSKMLAPTWLAQRLRQLGDIRRNSQRLDQINFRFAQVSRRISYKHRRTIIKPRSAASCARAWSFAGSRVKSGEKMDARAAPQVGFDANKVRALIAKYLGIDAERVTDEAHFRNNLDLDSLDQLELLILIEEEFSGVEFSDAAVEQIEIVGDLIRYMEINCLLGDLYAQTFRRSAA